MHVAGRLTPPPHPPITGSHCLHHFGRYSAIFWWTAARISRIRCMPQACGKFGDATSFLNHIRDGGDGRALWYHLAPAFGFAPCLPYLPRLLFVFLALDIEGGNAFRCRAAALLCATPFPPDAQTATRLAYHCLPTANTAALPFYTTLYALPFCAHAARLKTTRIPFSLQPTDANSCRGTRHSARRAAACAPRNYPPPSPPASGTAFCT